MLNPDSETVFDLGDLVWIVGDRRRLRDFEQSFDVDAPAPL
jgi:K+/H+ antiporter YhaU regulatory subunit KhtT